MVRRSTLGVDDVLRRGAARRRASFSLIELIAVMVLIGILLVLVVPHLGGVSGLSSDRQAQETLDATESAEVTLYAITGAFSSDPATLAGRLPGTTFVASPAAVTSDTAVSVSLTASGNTLVLASPGSGDDCWIIKRQMAATAGAPPELDLLVHTTTCSAAALPSSITAPTAPVGESWGQPDIVSAAGTSGTAPTSSTTAGTNVG